jgi:hypothetical protein
MNILLSVLRQQPYMVDSLLSEGYLNGIQLYTRGCASLSQDFATLGEQVQTVALNPRFLPVFQNSYIREISVSQWDALLADAIPWEPSESAPQHPIEWATFVPSSSRPDIGLLLPDDITTDTRFSAFTVVGNRRRFFSLSITPGWRVAQTIVSNNHCSPPDIEGCDIGTCQKCQKHEIQINDLSAVVCRCPCPSP